MIRCGSSIQRSVLTAVRIRLWALKCFLVSPPRWPNLALSLWEISTVTAVYDVALLTRLGSIDICMHPDALD
ncbi:uncharacterized protein LY79DRAFT_533269 [Colletotrichum navitas]|uniref:Uncharacterized protein n=1 Tax=Colletotrichum navitas TaxID=681940 RepID=A0AAD8QE80_9PEZI|nr:uncharacterized protein LY79DRAFT_533269 [Colletotrichum navitas]KAK1600326.1 hypothetical protein LY79DRAFT_533269 [Colletotrichum navitas]